MGVFQETLVRPAPLKCGDKIAIVSPASKIDPALIDAAVDKLQREGLEPLVMPHAKGEHGSFSSSVEARVADMRDALENPLVKGILCSRGGYGAVHLLEDLDRMDAECFHKWLIGFSDITALHALWRRKGVMSLHAAMAKHIGRGADGFACYGQELRVLCGVPADFRCVTHAFNVGGEVTGRLVGGNLAVLGGLIGTRFDDIAPGTILFMEDIAEPIYKVERILWQLRLRGVFDQIGGVLVGQFTDYSPSADHASVEEMMERFFHPYSFPRAYGLPMGHIEENAPLLLGATVHMKVASSGVEVRECVG